MKLTALIILQVAVFLLVTCIGDGAVADTDDDTRVFVVEVIRDARTDSERFTRLVDAVSLAADNRQLRIALLEKAVGYGTKSLRTLEDCTGVNNALAMLGEEDADRKPLWMSRQAVVPRRICVLTESQPEKTKAAWELVDLLIDSGNGYASQGKWINAIAAYRDAKSAAITFKLPNAAKLGGFVGSATYLYGVSKRIDASAKVLKASPDDVKARTSLVTATLTVMNDPAAAAGYLNDDLDERLQVFVPMAAKDAEDVPTAGCKDLGDWYYKELSSTAIPIVKLRMLRRAEQYYSRMLEGQETSDVGTVAVKLAMTQIKYKTAKLLFVDPTECSRCGGSAQAACGDCVIKGKTSGLNPCDECDATGLGKCRTCDGHWGDKCSRCKGSGKSYRDRGHDRGRKGRGPRGPSTCSSCKGTGLRHGRGESTRSGPCPTCGKRRIVSERGKGLCRRCKGAGGTSKCRTCLGTKIVPCGHCQDSPSPAAEDVAADREPKRLSPKALKRERDEDVASGKERKRLSPKALKRERDQD